MRTFLPLAVLALAGLGCGSHESAPPPVSDAPASRGAGSQDAKRPNPAVPHLKTGTPGTQAAPFTPRRPQDAARERGGQMSQGSMANGETNSDSDGD